MASGLIHGNLVMEDKRTAAFAGVSEPQHVIRLDDDDAYRTSFTSGVPVYWNVVVEFLKASTGTATNQTLKIFLGTKGKISAWGTGRNPSNTRLAFTHWNAENFGTGEKLYEIDAVRQDSPQFFSRQLGYGPDWQIAAGTRLDNVIRPHLATVLKLGGTNPSTKVSSWLSLTKAYDTPGAIQRHKLPGRNTLSGSGTFLQKL